MCVCAVSERSSPTKESKVLSCCGRFYFQTSIASSGSDRDLQWTWSKDCGPNKTTQKAGKYRCLEPPIAYWSRNTFSNHWHSCLCVWEYCRSVLPKKRSIAINRRFRVQNPSLPKSKMCKSMSVVTVLERRSIPKINQFSTFVLLCFFFTPQALCVCV